MKKAIKWLGFMGVLMLTVSLLSVSAFAATSVRVVDMQELESVDCRGEEDGVTDSYGHNYSANTLRLDASNNARISYYLDGGYTTFSGTFVAGTETGSGAKMNVAIFADGVCVYSLTDMTRQKAGESFQLDVTGVSLLEIKTTNSGEYSCGFLYLVKGSFGVSSTSSAGTEWSDLSDLTLIDSGYYTRDDSLWQDSYGYFHRNEYRLDGSNNAYALYNLDGLYTTYTATIATGSDTGSGAELNLWIYLDDVQVYKLEGYTKQDAPISISLDVTGGTVLKFVTTNTGEYSCGYLYLTDNILMAHVHTVEEEWILEREATCDREGLLVKYCTDCGELAEQQFIDTLAHTPGTEWAEVRAASCQEEGQLVLYCTVCGGVAKSQSIEALGHDWSEDVEVVGNFWGTITKQRTCQTCGETDGEAYVPLLRPVAVGLLVLGFLFVVALITQGLSFDFTGWARRSPRRSEAPARQIQRDDDDPDYTTKVTYD